MKATTIRRSRFFDMTKGRKGQKDVVWAVHQRLSMWILCALIVFSTRSVLDRIVQMPEWPKKILVIHTPEPSENARALKSNT